MNQFVACTDIKQTNGVMLTAHAKAKLPLTGMNLMQCAFSLWQQKVWTDAFGEQMSHTLTV